MRPMIARLTRIAVLASYAGAAALIAQQAPPPPPLVTSQEISGGLKPDGANWLTFGGNYSNHRYSPLTQLTPANVNRLVPKWTFQTATLGNFETTTLLRDNVLYVTGPLNMAWALDARTGTPDLALPARAPGDGADGVLRAGQPGIRRARRQAVHDDARRASARPRHQDRRGRLGCDAGGLPDRLRLDDCSAGREGQSDRRRGGRRVRHPRVHRRVRGEHGQARVAVLHDSRTRRAGPRTPGRAIPGRSAARASG